MGPRQRQSLPENILIDLYSFLDSFIFLFCVLLFTEIHSAAVALSPPGVPKDVPFHTCRDLFEKGGVVDC